jgi:hypothetical protein
MLLGTRWISDTARVVGFGADHDRQTARPLAGARRLWCVTSVGLCPPGVTHQRTFNIDASRPDCRALADYRTGEKAAGISSLFSCRIGRTPACGGHAPPGRRDSSRTRARSLRSLYRSFGDGDEWRSAQCVCAAARGEVSLRTPERAQDPGHSLLRRSAVRTHRSPARWIRPVASTLCRRCTTPNPKEILRMA